MRRITATGRPSLARETGMPTSQVRWWLPTELRRDLRWVAEVVGATEGELVTVALVRFLKVIKERWNQESMERPIPELYSLGLETRGFSVKDIMEGLRES